MPGLLEAVGETAGAAIRGGGLVLAGQVAHVGRVTLLLLRTLRRLPTVWATRSMLLQQMWRMGVDSLPLILVISVFIGAVTAIQADYQFRGLIPSNYLGTAVGKFVIIESGPVLTALVLAGRLGSAIAAEIGTMKEKEELDAMIVLDLDPLRYLSLPRLLAGVITFPLLVCISDLLAIFGGWLLVTLSLGITTTTYVSGLRFLFSTYDVWVGLAKAFIFGGVVATLGYYHGLMAGAGARGVGQATMKAVVSSCVLILILDFVVVYVAY